MRARDGKTKREETSDIRWQKEKRERERERERVRRVEAQAELS